jgi:hypothetical protein
MPHRRAIDRFDTEGISADAQLSNTFFLWTAQMAGENSQPTRPARPAGPPALPPTAAGSNDLAQNAFVPSQQAFDARSLLSDGRQPDGKLQKFLRRAQVVLFIWLSESLSFSVSLVAHVGLLLSMALWVVANNQSSPALTLKLNTGQEVADTVITEMAMAETPSMEELNDFSTPAELSEVEINIPEIEINLSDATIADAPSVSGQLTSATEASNSMFGSENGTGTGSGEGASFFGVEAGGDRFIFVVDSSTSMLEQRWYAARNELGNSLATMGPDQRYFVFCFDYQTHMALDKEATDTNYILPSRANNLRIRRWLRKIENGPDTRPATALQMAISMKPDAIFLLSDGEIRDRSLAILDAVNHDPITGETLVPIHTISLFSDVGIGSLQEIARRNGGTFRSVD